MNGLEKIIKDINDETQAECDKIIAEAQAKADEIIKNANANADKISSAENDKLKAFEKDLMNRSVSAAALEKRKIILAEKQKIISDIINKAHEEILSLPDKEYFDILMKIAAKNIQSGSGEIFFNAKDKKRLPKNFIPELNKQAEKIGGKVTLSDKTVNIDGGFVLAYGGIEENCSFEAIFHSKSEEMKDTVHRIINLKK